MDGPFFVDTRSPHIQTDVTAVTLSTTAKALLPIANLPVLGSNYFGWIGKAVRLTIFGRLVTGATPGNGTASLYWGNGTDANGTIIVSTAAMTLTASMTSGSSWLWEMIIRCRALGTSGSLMATGTFNFLNSATSTTAASSFMVPATAPVPVTVDLTTASVISPQFLRSGSTVESIQVHDFLFEALN